MTTHRSADQAFFVSIAAYRDPDLLCTIADCLAKACHPDRLRFGICWQHDRADRLPSWIGGSRFRVLDVPWRESCGACWARAEIMELWDDEDWYLQLDSHHRFSQDWDAKLIEQAALTRSPKPVLTTYPAAFAPGAEADAAEQVTRIDFRRFTPEGAILTAPGLIVDPPAAPVRARFVSANFLFAPGSFVVEVPYDPELYFIGEEITLGVRAFTHGYDLFHPSRHILWHEYTRSYRRRHWDDHKSELGVELAWHDRDARSRAKVARLLSDPAVGPYGFGRERGFAEYEKYAGVSFRHRRVQDYTRFHGEPPNPHSHPSWAEHVRDHKIPIEIQLDELAPTAVEDPTFWYVGIHDSRGAEIHRADAGRAELAELLASGRDRITLLREFESEAKPSSWVVWPHSASRGWLTRVTGQIDRRPWIFVSIASYRDPDLWHTIADCIAKARDPRRLRFGICWQHSPDEILPDWLRSSRCRIVDVPWRDSRGQCWARAQIMPLWDGEDWYLQLDAHHRFNQDWDTKLIQQAAIASSGKPLLSAPGAPFMIGAPLVEDGPWRVEFAGFRADGMPETKIGRLPTNVARTPPVAARWVCGHLLFAPGSFVEEVPYDPELYFGAEDATVALRAFTHGYDLFHPAESILWHDYTPSRRKHWDDHTADQRGQQPWYDLREASFTRAARLVSEASVGRHGLGESRTLEDYEAYAGISFRDRKVQDYTLFHEEPPNPPTDPGWSDRVRHRRVEIVLDSSDLFYDGDVRFCYVGVHDSGARELCRYDATAAELHDAMAARHGQITLVREFQSEAVPAAWTVIPYSESTGWLKRITRFVPHYAEDCQ